MRARTVTRGFNYFFAGAIFLLSLLFIVRHTSVQPTIGLGVSGVGVGLLYVLASFLKVSSQAKLLMMTFSVIMTMYAFEGFLHWFGNPLDYDNQRYMAAISAGTKFDRRDELQIYLDEKAQGKDVYPFIPSSNFVKKSRMDTIKGKTFFPVSSIASVATIYCNESGEFVSYVSDEYGFNNVQSIWGEKLQIAIVGDSFAQGACVPQNKTVAGLLRKSYPKTLSIGSSGNGPMLELIGVKEYLKSAEPQTVIWFYFEGNDLLDLQDEKKNPFIMQYLNSDFSQDLMSRQADVDKVRKAFVKGLEKLRAASVQLEKKPQSELWQFIRLYELRRLIGLTFEGDSAELPSAVVEKSNERAKSSKTTQQQNPDNWQDGHEPTEEETKRHYEEMIAELAQNLPLLRSIIDDAQRTINSWGGKMVVVYVPQWERYKYDTADTAFQRQDVLPIFKALNIDVIDLHPVIEAQPDPLSLYRFRLNGHFNEKGYQLVADTIKAYLDQDQ